MRRPVACNRLHEVSSLGVGRRPCQVTDPVPAGALPPGVRWGGP
ncbi:MAG: hypothetical protein AVDCRST_MAG59-4854 [uncultured Thermomicrobiales bacterium]|uniref:Uncharacterized protein n=1 Tax=uncultured Thermomicrobiales bacterium TaxID=1645740 RepID=A0A6J4VLB6_9BACT|nr:MAG: hypothetical protein AVDCRST_MAG59-4854 [uncultured Thermomicrobiales bacterium]